MKSSDYDIYKKGFERGEKEASKKNNNCCGASFLPEKVRKILTVDIFNESCCIHDDNYTTGGTKKDKEIADKIFLESMLFNIEIEVKNIFKKKYYQGLAHLYYFMVCKFGDSSFNFKEV